MTAQQNAKTVKPSRVKREFFNFIRSIEQELVAYNKATIFEDSESVTGKSLGFYSKATEIISNGRKKAGDPYSLKDTGVFLESLFAKVGTNSILFDASDPKKKEVFKNLLTDDIFGLQDDDLKKVIDVRLLPFLIKYYKKLLT